MIMEEWIQTKLSEILDFPIPEEMIQYIVTIENQRDLENYLSSLLGSGNPKYKQFITDLKKQRASCNNQTGYKKIPDNDDSKPKKQNEKKKGKAKGRENVQVQAQEVIKSEKIEKKKTKFSNLYSGESILLKGRHRCDCEAKRHALINNCLSCGRIVCAQEGAGLCFFCGSLVCSEEQQMILHSNSKQANALFNKLTDRKINGLEESLKHRNKLLEYDSNSARRTKVIDDQSDYYQMNNTWLTAAERENFRKQETEAFARRHMSRFEKKVVVDLLGREVTEEDEFINQLHNLDSEDAAEVILEFDKPNICPTIEYDRPTFIEMEISETTEGSKRIKSHNVVSKIQDKEYLEMSDQGVCLSLHQPYASLLVAGIKTHEGRTWYSSHRGRLWIASTVKVPSNEEVFSIQQSYRVLKNEQLKFPETYPTGCLLGCVTVTDVLSQEDYRKLYPGGESDSPYVYICEGCYTLPIHLPIKGKHKIYKLDKKLHQAASKFLEKMIKIGKQ